MVGKMRGMMANKIERDWRNWNGKKDSSQQANKSGLNTHSSSADGDGGGVTPSPVAINMKLQSKSSRLYAPSGGKVNTGTSNIKTKYNFENALRMFNKGIDTKYATSDARKYRKFLSWSNDSSRRYRVNDKTIEKSFELNMKILQKRRLANSLAVVVAKIAEDRAGEPVVGDDYWSVPELLNRVVSKQQLSSCKETREKEKIIIILDTSPSCSEQSAFFMDVAKSSCDLNDLEMYDAPNGFIVKEYSNKLKEFVPIDRDVSRVFSEWHMFSGRTIIFFGDFDGHRIINKVAGDNNIYWFNPAYRPSMDEWDKSYSKTFLHNGGSIYRCRDEKDFMNIVRKMR
jgi:hypothetical protein